MANVIFLAVSFVGLFTVLMLLFVNVRRSLGSRPVRMDLASLNNSESASDYDLVPFAKIACSRFAQSLDM